MPVRQVHHGRVSANDLRLRRNVRLLQRRRRRLDLYLLHGDVQLYNASGQHDLQRLEWMR